MMYHMWFVFDSEKEIEFKHSICHTHWKYSEYITTSLWTSLKIM